MGKQIMINDQAVKTLEKMREILGTQSHSETVLEMGKFYATNKVDLASKKIDEAVMMLQPADRESFAELIRVLKIVFRRYMNTEDASKPIKAIVETILDVVSNDASN